MSRQLTLGNNTFEVVDEVPPGFKVWGISIEDVKGFLPLFEDSDIPFQINKDTLKAIYVGSTSTINTLIHIGKVSGIRSTERALEVLNEPTSSPRLISNAVKFLKVAKGVKGL